MGRNCRTRLSVDPSSPNKRVNLTRQRQCTMSGESARRLRAQRSVRRGGKGNRLTGPSGTARRRAIIPIAAAVLFLVADAWFRLQFSGSGPSRGFLAGLLAVLGVVASVGWLFVGKPARDPDALPPAAIPDMVVPSILTEAAVRGINRLGIGESTKDALIRWLTAFVFAAMAFGWDLYIQNIARR